MNNIVKQLVKLRNEDETNWLETRREGKGECVRIR